MTTVVAPPNNASKWQMGFNSVFKGLKTVDRILVRRGEQKQCRILLPFLGQLG
jgi:hypothetical protein